MRDLILRLNKFLFECKEKNKNIAKKAAVEDPLLEVEVPHSDLVYIFRYKCVKSNDNSLNHRTCVFNKGAFYFKYYFRPSPKS